MTLNYTKILYVYVYIICICFNAFQPPSKSKDKKWQHPWKEISIVKVHIY